MQTRLATPARHWRISPPGEPLTTATAQRRAHHEMYAYPPLVDRAEPAAQDPPRGDCACGGRGRRRRRGAGVARSAGSGTRPAGRGAARSRVRRVDRVAGRTGRADPEYRPDRDRGATGRQRHGRPDGAGPRAGRVREPGNRRGLRAGHRDRLLGRRRRGLALVRGLRRRDTGGQDHHPGIPAARRARRGRGHRLRPGGVPGRLRAARARQRPADPAAAVRPAAAALAVAVEHR
jgi:hypothetical protein